MPYLIYMKKPGTGANPATGSVTITGTMVVGTTLSHTETIVDLDGLGAFSYQWYNGGVPIVGETGTTYVTVAGDLGDSISLTISFLDQGGNAESVTSAAVTILQVPTQLTTCCWNFVPGLTYQGQSPKPPSYTGNAMYLPGPLYNGWPGSSTNRTVATIVGHTYNLSGYHRSIDHLLQFSTNGASFSDTATSSTTNKIVDYTWTATGTSVYLYGKNQGTANSNSTTSLTLQDIT